MDEQKELPLNETLKEWSSETILNTVNEMNSFIREKGLTTVSQKQRGNKLLKRYSNFEKAFPTLFANIVELKANENYLSQLKYMLEMRNNVNSGAKAYTTSVEVGETLAKKYIREY